MKSLHLLATAVMLFAAMSVQSATNCADLFGQVASRVESLSAYEKDFGPGVSIRKLSNTEFRIEPPLEIATSIRQAQRAVSKRSQDGYGSITVLFSGFSEGEVLGFRAMLDRDTKIKGDATLAAILLGSDSSAGRSYEDIRKTALFAQERMNRRYRWADATVSSQTASSGEREERYLLTARYDASKDEFFLKIRVRAASMLKDRTARIRDFLSKPGLVNATAEQLAHEMISSLKKSDRGITAVTLKVISGDFVIAENQ